MVDESLAPGREFRLDEQRSAYLARVLRLQPGAQILVFNGRDGEWAARLVRVEKRGVEIELLAQTRPQAIEPDVTLLFAPIKRAGVEWIVEKATEIGARRLAPVITRRTNTETLRLDRLRAIAREAAEQCERLAMPEIDEPKPLERALRAWPLEQPLFFADETSRRPAVIPSGLGGRSVGLLIGPEGGFEPEEKALVQSFGFQRPLYLGRNILRAETAATAGLVLLIAAVEYDTGEI